MLNTDPPVYFFSLSDLVHVTKLVRCGNAQFMQIQEYANFIHRALSLTRQQSPLHSETADRNKTAENNTDIIKHRMKSS